MLGTRHLVEQLAVVEQRAHERADRDPGERAVVGAAAAPEPVAGGGDGEARHEHHVGRADRVDAEQVAGGPEQPAGRRGEAAR